MNLTLEAAVSTFGAKAKRKLSNPAAKGQPEDQIRAPFEDLLAQVAELCQFRQGAVTAVGESSVSDLKTRPDYAVSAHNALIGFIELKAPGKGADPRKFKDPHDKAQWDKLRALPNIIYTDGNAFSLWQDGELVGSFIRLIGDIETSGNKLQAPSGLLGLFESFLNWKPVPPRSAKELAESTARLPARWGQIVFLVARRSRRGAGYGYFPPAAVDGPCSAVGAARRPPRDRPGSHRSGLPGDRWFLPYGAAS